MTNNYLKYISKSELDTINFAHKIAKLLTKNDIVILNGDLGSGKTKFTEGLLSHFNIKDEISSPTFNIVNEYTTNIFPIFHFDVYRLTSIDEFYELGGTEYFERGLCIIEWGDFIKDCLPNNYIQIDFERDYMTEENIRIIQIKKGGKRFENLIN